MERPSWTLERLERAVEGFATQLQCAICLCAYDNPVSLPCNHCFCEECIHRALELKAVCPICKAPAKKRRLRYDTMIQQLLRATEMLCAPPVAADQGTAKVKIEKAVEKSPAKGKAAVGSEEIKAPGSNGDASEKPPTKKKAKKAPVAAAVELRSTRSSPRRSVAANDSQTETPMSPALFEITAPRAAKTLAATAITATSPHRRIRSPNGKQAAKSPDGGKQTPSPRNRPRRAAANAAGPAKTAAKGEASNGTRAPATKVALNSRSADPGMTAESQTQLPPEIERFEVGDLVEVVERMWAGVNKPGGTARIKTANADGTYNVKFVIGSGKEKSVPSVFIRRPAEEIVSDTTPGRAVKKRQRRRVSDAATSPVISSAKVNRVGSSPRSTGKAKAKIKRSGMVFLCSGIKEARMGQIKEWAELLGADVVQHWSNHVTHLIVKCVSSDDDDEKETSVRDSDASRTPQTHTTGKRKLFSDPPSETQPRRWVVIRSLKYLKALVGGRWIVSDEWLEACATHGGYVSEVDYEADGHLKGKRIHDAVRRSRHTREKLLRLSRSDVDRMSVGTMLFADFCFHVIGEFLSPMPPITELDSLLRMGGGKLIPTLADIPVEMQKRENRPRRLVIVSDKINPQALREQTRRLKIHPQLQAVPSVVIVNYQWVLNSISEAKLRPFL